MKKYLFYLIGLLIIACCGLFYTANHYRNDSIINKHNLLAANDTITILEDGINIKSSQILRWKDRTKTQKDSINHLQRILKTKIKYIAELQTEFKTDTIHTTDTIVVDSTLYTFKFNYADDYLQISGFTNWNLNDNVSYTTITSNTVSIPLTVGLTKDWKIFVRSSNPNINITSINGALLNKYDYLNSSERKSNFSIGVGVGLYGGYNIMNKDIYFGPGIGLSFNYNFVVL